MQRPRLGPPVDHLDGVWYAIMLAPLIDHKVCYYDSRSLYADDVEWERRERRRTRKPSSHFEQNVERSENSLILGNFKHFYHQRVTSYLLFDLKMQEGSFRVASTFYEKTDKKGRVRGKATDKPFFTRLSTKPGFYRINLVSLSPSLPKSLTFSQKRTYSHSPSLPESLTSRHLPAPAVQIRLPLESRQIEFGALLICGSGDWSVLIMIGAIRGGKDA
ncbi:hypothetical protein LguiA_010687 [Lonicera macranthoides]